MNQMIYASTTPDISWFYSASSCSPSASNLFNVSAIALARDAPVKGLVIKASDPALEHSGSATNQIATIY
jgi:hypothetical protein